MKKQSEQLENYYDYKYNFVSPKQHKINKARLQKMQARKSLNGKSNDELIDRIYLNKVNSIEHIKIALNQLINNGQSQYAQKINSLQEEFVSHVDHFNRE